MKIKVFALAAALAVCLSACKSGPSAAEPKSLYAQGLTIISLMSEMAQSEDYVNTYTGSDAIKEILKTAGSGDYTAPKAVYAISASEEDLAAMAELYGFSVESDSLRAFLLQRVRSSLMTQVNSMAGAETLAAASVCTASKTFVNENADSDVTYLYTYDDAAPVAVSFTVGEDHAVAASGSFVLYDGFTCASEAEIESFFSYLTVDVTEVQPEK